jgi:hypothetical protein
MNRTLVIVTNSCWEVSIMYAPHSSESANSQCVLVLAIGHLVLGELLGSIWKS